MDSAVRFIQVRIVPRVAGLGEAGSAFANTTQSKTPGVSGPGYRRNPLLELLLPELVRVRRVGGRNCFGKIPGAHRLWSHQFRLRCRMPGGMTRRRCVRGGFFKALTAEDFQFRDGFVERRRLRRQFVRGTGGFLDACGVRLR